MANAAIIYPEAVQIAYRLQMFVPAKAVQDSCRINSQDSSCPPIDSIMRLMTVWKIIRDY